MRNRMLKRAMEWRAGLTEQMFKKYKAHKEYVKELNKRDLTIGEICDICSNGSVYAECNDGKTTLRPCGPKEFVKLVLN